MDTKETILEIKNIYDNCEEIQNITINRKEKNTIEDQLECSTISIIRKMIKDNEFNIEFRKETLNMIEKYIESIENDNILGVIYSRSQSKDMNITIIAIRLISEYYKTAPHIISFLFLVKMITKCTYIDTNDLKSMKFPKTEYLDKIWEIQKNEDFSNKLDGTEIWNLLNNL